MDYARALVEHPKWTWHIGMVAERGARVYDIGKGFAGYEVPDINHPATKGWLLHMLREATGAGCYATEPALALESDAWAVYDYRCGALGTAPTEGEALSAALLAVWGQA